jgi:hypothetical protein
MQVDSCKPWGNAAAAVAAPLLLPPLLDPQSPSERTAPHCRPFTLTVSMANDSLPVIAQGSRIRAEAIMEWLPPSVHVAKKVYR